VVPPASRKTSSGEQLPSYGPGGFKHAARWTNSRARPCKRRRRAQEQKAKQRHKEYEKKREAKARDRQMYILRHTRDYEALELPIGAARADVKAAYRKLAKARRRPPLAWI